MDYVGQEYSALCPPLEVLAVVEETTVRERAVRGLQDICSKMSPAQCHQEMLPLMKRLAEAEWFTPRRSACGLLNPIYNKVDVAQRAEVLETMNHLVADETPMVRRAVAASLGGMAMAPGGNQVAVEKLSPVWMTLTEDPHFSVRVAAVSSTGALVSAMGKQASLATVMPHVTKGLAPSRGWKVRNALAGQLGALSSGLAGCAVEQIVPICVELCRDYEDDVSESAMGQLLSVAQAIKRDEGDAGLAIFAQNIFPVLEYMAGVEERRTEMSPRIRRTVARTTINLAAFDPKVLGHKCLNVWEYFLNDTVSKDATDVSRVTMEGLHDILRTIGSDFSLSGSSKWGNIIKAMYENSKSKAVDEVNARIAANQNGQAQNPMGDALPGDPVETPKWRVRVYIIENMNSLIKADKPQAVQLWSTALYDEACEVRQAAGRVLDTLCDASSSLGGAPGVAKEMCPILNQFFRKSQETNSFQHRVAAVRSAAVLSKYPPTWTACQSIIGEALKDPVTNVTLAALTMAKEFPQVASTFQNEITALTKSSDPDVADFARAVAG